MEIISVGPDQFDTLCKGFPISNDTVEFLFVMFYGKRIGYIMINQHENDFFIEQFHIDNVHRNKGYGTQLLQRCLEDYDSIKIMVAGDNHRTIYMCEKHGFRTIQTTGFMNILAR